MKRIWPIILLCLFMGLFISCVGEKGVIDVTYTFEGVHAEDAGYAEGTITLTPTKDATLTSGYYLLYFADRDGLLGGYDEFASIPITGEEIRYTVKGGTLIPPAATKLVVFESERAFLDELPAYEARAAQITIPQKKRLTLTDPAFTFGAISDVHMNYESLGYGAYEKWKNALNFFAEQQMDRVIVTGDLTGDTSLSEQYQQYLDIVAASDYPLENIHEAIGNHGNTIGGRLLFTKFTAGEGEDHPSAQSPWFSVMIEGETEDARDNLFLFMAQELRASGDSAKYDNFSKKQIDWVESMLKQYRGTETNIFIIEHSPFLDYGPGDRHSGDYTAMVTFDERFTQTIRLKELLETNRNVIVLSGHTHLSLYDGENYSDEDGTSCRMIHVPSGCQPATYNNGNNTLGSGDGRHAVNSSYGSEAYTVAVYDECIIFTGRNLSTGTIVPSACYILPIDKNT